MYYKIDLTKLPRVSDFYIVNRRRNVSQLVDSNHVIMVIMSGTVDAIFGGKTYTLDQGDVFFVPANHMYSLSLAPGMESIITYMHFSVEDMVSYSLQDFKGEILASYESINLPLSTRKRVLSNLNAVYIANMNSKPSETVLEMLSKITVEFADSRSIMYNMQVAAVLISLLVETSVLNITQLHASNVLDDSGGNSQKTDKLVRYISEHYMEKITLSDLRRCCNLSNAQLIRICKLVLGTTPIRYITDYRLAKGKEYLYYNPDMTISEISDKLGFANQHYFAKLFKQKFGESPSEYRKRKFSGKSVIEEEMLRF